MITQPDKPAGRGRAVTASPVKQRALAAAVPVLQPPRLRDAGWPERLAECRAEVAVVAAFGQILPKAVLDVPVHGSINVHGSVLPRYRGAAPIAWAIMRGETETGITTFQMDPGMDTGDMLLTEETPIGPEETAGELSTRMAEIGARLLLRTLEGIATLPRVPQDHAKRHHGAAPQEGRRLATAGGARARSRQPRARLQPMAGRRARHAGRPAPDLARGRAGRIRRQRAGRHPRPLPPLP